MPAIAPITKNFQCLAMNEPAADKNDPMPGIKLKSNVHIIHLEVVLVMLDS